MICASCGMEASTDLCSHHVYATTEWCAANRIWCNFFHRGILPERLTPTDRIDDFWTTEETIA